jgi:hypothetical protein
MTTTTELPAHAPTPTPPRIVEADGTVHTGWFAQPFEVANLDEAPAQHLLSGLRGTPFDMFERGMRRWRLKQWEYVSVVTDRVLFACAIVDAGYVGNAFAYVVDRLSKKKQEYSTLTPGARGITVAASSVDGTSRIRWPGFGTIAIHNEAAKGKRRIEAHLEGRLGPNKRPPLRARFEIRDDGARQPIVVVEESAPGRWLYTHKCYGLDAGGIVHCGDISDEVGMGQAHAGLDFNRGYRPRETYWNWAAASGKTSKGTPVGFNLTAHRRPDAAAPDGGDDATDCAIWLGDRCEKLERVEFHYDHGDLMSEWRIRDAAGLVDLRFTPDGERAEDVNFGLVVSRFHQPYGRFSGDLRDRAGGRYPVDGLYGVVEQHFARW